MVGEIWVPRARGQEGEVETSAPCTQTTVIARVSSILATTVITLWFYPVLPPQKRQEEPTTSKDDDDSGDVTWVEFVKGMSSDQFQAWPMFPGDGDQWVEMYSNNAPEWLDFDNFFCGIQHFKQNQNSYEEQSEMDYYRLISMMLGAHCGRSNLAHSWPNHSMSIHQHAKPFLLKIVQKIVKMMFS